MADEQIVTNIVAKSDFSGLIRDLNQVQSALTQLQQTTANTNKTLANQIRVMNRQFGETLRSTGQFSTQFVSIGSDVEKFGKENFKREILRLCKSKGEFSYFEAKMQFENNVLESDEWYNSYIMVRVNKNHLTFLKG